MIVSEHPFGLQLVRQDHHMHHAGELAKSWGNSRFARLDLHRSFVTAVDLHDNGWAEFDDSLPFKNGRPVNFVDIDLTQHAEFYERGYERVKQQDEYAGSLIGMHWIGLYMSRYGYDPTLTYDVPGELKEFMRGLISQVEGSIQAGLRGYWTATRPKSAFENEVWFHYELMQLLDRLSLFLCMNAHGTTAETTLGPIRFSPDDHESFDVTAALAADGRVTIEPFPFERELELEVAAWRLPQATFRTAEEYRESVADEFRGSVTNLLVAR